MEREATPEDLANRPKLNLLPRSRPVEAADGEAGNAKSSSIFGGARPVDTTAKLLEIEQKEAAERNRIKEEVQREQQLTRQPPPPPPAAAKPQGSAPPQQQQQQQTPPPASSPAKPAPAPAPAPAAPAPAVAPAAAAAAVAAPLSGNGQAPAAAPASKANAPAPTHAQGPAVGIAGVMPAGSMPHPGMLHGPPPPHSMGPGFPPGMAAFPHGFPGFVFMGLDPKTNQPILVPMGPQMMQQMSEWGFGGGPCARPPLGPC